MQNEQISNTTWTNPDLTILEDHHVEAPDFPSDILHTEWKHYCSDVSLSANTSYDFVGAGLLTAAAAAIGNARLVKFGTWKAPAIIWTAIVGDPSTRKTPALAPFRDHLQSLEEAMWDDVEEGGEPQLVIEDVTARATKNVAAANPKGLIVFTDEFRLFLKATTGSDEGFWNKSYDGGAYILNRAKERPLRIPALSISVLAAAQPDLIRSMAGREMNTGFGARWLFVNPNPPSGYLRSFDVDHGKAADAFARLHALSLEDGRPRPISLSPQAADVADNWMAKRQPATERATGLWQQWLRKQDGMLLRYALVLEHLWWAMERTTPEDGPDIVSADAINGAALFIDSYAAPMAERTLDLAQRTKEVQLATTLAHLLKAHGINRFETRKIYRGTLFTSGQTPTELKTSENVNAACLELEDARLIRFVGTRDKGGHGKKKNEYEVNPLLLSGGHLPPAMPRKASPEVEANLPVEQPAALDDVPVPKLRRRESRRETYRRGRARRASAQPVEC